MRLATLFVKPAFNLTGEQRGEQLLTEDFQTLAAVKPPLAQEIRQKADGPPPALGVIDGNVAGWLATAVVDDVDLALPDRDLHPGHQARGVDGGEPGGVSSAVRPRRYSTGVANSREGVVALSASIRRPCWTALSTAAPAANWP